MGQRNMLCTRQMFDMEIEQDNSQLCPDPCIVLGNMVDFPNPTVQSALSSAGNNTNFNLPAFTEHHESGTVYLNQSNNLQQRHPASNIDLCCVAPHSFYNPYMVPSSSSRFFPVPVNHGSADQIPSSINHGVMADSRDERLDHFMDDIRGPFKRKNAEGVSGNYDYANVVANSSSSSLNLSLNSGLQNLDESFETGGNLLAATAFTLPEHRGGVMPVIEGSQRSVRSRPSAVSLQLESVAQHHNHFLQGNHMVQSFHPAGGVWVEQFGSNVHDGGSSNWNYTPSIPYLQGGSLNVDSLEIGNMGGPLFQNPSSRRSSTITLQPSPPHNHHQHLPLVQVIPVQGMPGHIYNHQPQVQVPSYGHPMNNDLHHVIVNPSRNGHDSGFRYPRPFTPGTAEQIYRASRQLIHAVPEASDAHMRVISPEDIAVLELSGFYGIRNSIDHHRDMRLDIDSMSYEELLALEERIGDVNTGLSEEFILRNLKTRIHVSHAASSLSGKESSIVTGGKCIICQVEYEENERIGILDCGHEYHADCVRQWLLLKNLCPICKTSALGAEDTRREG